MLNALQNVFGELEKVCLEISDLCDEEDHLNDIEDIRFEVETCVAMATEYLEARKGDPPSTASSIALSWVRKHMGQFGVNDEVSSNHSGQVKVYQNQKWRKQQLQNCLNIKGILILFLDQQLHVFYLKLHRFWIIKSQS